MDISRQQFEQEYNLKFRKPDYQQPQNSAKIDTFKASFYLLTLQGQIDRIELIRVSVQNIYLSQGVVDIKLEKKEEKEGSEYNRENSGGIEQIMMIDCVFRDILVINDRYNGGGLIRISQDTDLESQKQKQFVVQNNEFINIINFQNRFNSIRSKVLINMKKTYRFHLINNRFVNCSYDYDNGLIGIYAKYVYIQNNSFHNSSYMFDPRVLTFLNNGTYEYLAKQDQTKNIDCQYCFINDNCAIGGIFEIQAMQLTIRQTGFRNAHAQ